MKRLICSTALGYSVLSMTGLTVAQNAAAKQTDNDKKPNVIVIFTDDQGYGDLSCTCSSDMRTPNIDNIFEKGVRMDNFYANASLSSPSRASLLTGRYCDMVGVQGVIRNEAPHSYWQNFGYLSPDATTLPTVMKENGYNTALIGKWHLGYTSPNTPNERGFDLFKGFLGGMMDDYYKHTRMGYPELRINKDFCPPVEGHISDVLSEWAIEYIDEQKKSDKPFFLYLAYNAPHVPLQAPEDWVKMVKKREPGISDTRAHYVALIEHMDAGIGRLMARLKKNDQLDNTLIIFCSDNGGEKKSESNNGPYRGSKSTMYEGGLRVPAAFYLKGRIEHGQSDRIAQIMDIFPTICDICGIETSVPVDGISIYPTLEGNEQNTENRYFWYMIREWGTSGNKMQTAIRHGEYKLVQNAAAKPYELFNLAEDPQETKPLPLKGDIYKDLFNQMRIRIAEAGAVPWNVPKDQYVSWEEMSKQSTK